MKRVSGATMMIGAAFLCHAASAQMVTTQGLDAPVGKEAGTIMVRVRALGVIPESSSSSVSVIGGNVDDAVTAKHVPVTAEGMLADGAGHVVDTRYPWMAVLEVLYVR